MISFHTYVLQSGRTNQDSYSKQSYLLIKPLLKNQYKSQSICNEAIFFYMNKFCPWGSHWVFLLLNSCRHWKHDGRSLCGYINWTSYTKVRVSGSKMPWDWLNSHFEFLNVWKWHIILYFIGQKAQYVI